MGKFLLPGAPALPGRGPSTAAVTQPRGHSARHSRGPSPPGPTQLQPTLRPRLGCCSRASERDWRPHRTLGPDVSHPRPPSPPETGSKFPRIGSNRPREGARKFFMKGLPPNNDRNGTSSTSGSSSRARPHGLHHTRRCHTQDSARSVSGSRFRGVISACRLSADKLTRSRARVPLITLNAAHLPKDAAQCVSEEAWPDLLDY